MRDAGHRTAKKAKIIYPPPRGVDITMYHLIAKDKVAEQHILGKHSNCNSFGVTMALLNRRNLKVAITQLSKVQQV